MFRGSRFRLPMLASGVLAFTLVGVFALPYAFPVAPAVSDSYLVGFNNRVAVLCFLVGGALFAALCAPAEAGREVEDRSLPRWTLPVVTLLVLALCAGWRWHREPLLGSEASYFLDRQMHLDAGQRLYRGFEFIYGPLLIYPGHVLSHAFGLTTRQGSLWSLLGQWVIGAVMLWFVVAKADVPTARRGIVLAFLLATVLLNVVTDGANYSPMRIYAAAALSVAVALFWRRFRKPYGTALVAIGAVALGFCVSPEQGMTLAAGLPAYAAYLVWADRRVFPIPASALTVLGSGCVYLAVAHTGMLASTSAIAHGGLCFPMLPSGQNLLILGTYLYGFVWLFAAVRRRTLDETGIPLALCGLSLLVPSFGRCDRVHLISAVPLFVVSVLAISAHRRAFWVWLALAVYVLFPLQFLVQASNRRVHAVIQASVGTAPVQAAGAARKPESIGDRTYFAPLGVPLGNDGHLRWRADSGFYLGLWDVTSPETIQAKADEITRRNAPFLLLPDTDADSLARFWDTEENVEMLHGLEGAPWVPKAKNPPLSTKPIEQAIVTEYVPTGEAQDGWRVWTRR